jgi:epoxide hydrolase
LSDSPAGLAAWLLEKFHAWSGNESSFAADDLLTTATIYWATNTAASSSRIYYEAGHSNALRLAPHEKVQPPAGVLTFPRGAEPNLPRALVEPSYNITRWVDSATGGHFPAFETPQLFASELREFARPLRA